jgi:type IV fimbrial biogenesis protein FimT
MANRTQFRFSRGFTLIELMVVVAIAAVLLAIGVPSFKSFIAGQRVKAAASDFATAAVFARSEAIKRNAEVGVVAATTGWKDGWSITAGAVTLGSQSAFPGVLMTSAVTQVVYLGSGRLKEQTLVSSLQVNGSDGSPVRCVSFDLSGLPKTRLGNC